MEESDFKLGQEELYITKESVGLLNTIAKWTKFLSILGFIFIGIMIIALLSTGVLILGMNSYAHTSHMYHYMPGVFSWGYVLTYLVMLILYFIPLFFLFKFSSKVKQAIDANNTQALTQSLHFLKSHYMTIGILIIAGIVCFIVSLFIIIAGIM